MMNLKSGIFIHNQLPEGYDAVSVNSGTLFHDQLPAEMVDFGGYQFRPAYEDYAYVAKRDWRSLTAGEIGYLRAGRQRNDHNTVYLGEIPSAVRDIFVQMDIAGSASREEVMARLAKDPGKTRELNEAMSVFLSPLAGNRPFHFHCIGINFPNIEMVACDTTGLPAGFKPPDVRYMGMHNDGTAKMTLHTAHRFGNRISVNLGQEDRYFLFVNLSMIQALNMLKKKVDVRSLGLGVGNIPRVFFQHFPDYPVIRIRQKPFQYYIAPTDNIFHDGSTLGCTKLDITIVYFGYFSC